MQKLNIKLLTSALLLFFLTYSSMVLAQEKSIQKTMVKDMPDQLLEKRTLDYKDQLEKYLQDWIIEGYPQRAESAWNRDYSSIDAFARSVEPNRDRWKAVLNPPVLRKTGTMEKRPHPYLEDINAEWVELSLGPITAQAILAFPENASKDTPVPLVIVQHGLGSYPETIFSMNSKGYKAYGRELLKAGFAVLAPMNLRSTPFRNYIERYCRLIGTTLPGIELSRIQHLLDIVLTDPRINADRVGMWGQSLGGMATLMWMPLEPRIKAGIIGSYFNHRLTKMAVPDDRYTSYMVVDEDHIFFRGWLTEFADHDVVSMICPRPLMIHHGKRDRIAHWPHVEDKFNIAKTHYEKLNIDERIDIEMFEGGHEVRPESGIKFLTRWLMP